MKRSLKTSIALTVVLVTAAACGSSSGGSSGGSSSSSQIELSGFGVLQSQAFGFPETEDGAKAAVKAINAAGGVKGHKIRLQKFCNDAADANKAAACAQASVDSKAVANVGTLSVNGTQAQPVLDAAGLTQVAPVPISPIEFNSPDVFLLVGGTFTEYGGMPWIAASQGAKNVVVVNSDTPAAASNKAIITAQAAAAGVNISKYIVVPPNTIDLASIYARVAAEHPDAVLLPATPPDVINFWKAAAGGGNKVPLITSPIAEAQLKAGGSAAEGTYVSAPAPSPTLDPLTAQFRKEMAASNSGALVNDQSLDGWLSVHLFAAVAATVTGDITRKSVHDAFTKLTNFDFMWFKGLTYSKPGPFADYPRLVKTETYVQQVKDGKVVPTGKVVNLGPGS